VRRIEVRLYGSLSATGIGHGTDNATIMGLMGEWPDAIDPTQIVPRIADLRETNTLQLDGRLPIEFVWARDMLLLDENLPYHPNAMTLIAEGEQGELHRDTYYSVGGGFRGRCRPGRQRRAGCRPDRAAVRFQQRRRAAAPVQAKRPQRVAIDDGQRKGLAQRRRDPRRPAQALEAMQECVNNGLKHEGTCPAG
jgi:L-serine dehydratase